MVKVKEGRGKFLVVLLAIQVILLIDHLRNLVGPDFGSIPLAVRLIEIVIHGGILVGIWKWRKIAAYAFFLYFIVVSIYTLNVSLAIFRNTTNSDVPTIQIILPAILIFVAYGVLWFFAFKRKWHLFV